MNKMKGSVKSFGFTDLFILWKTGFFNFSAGNFGTGISCRLAGKVIGHIMNNCRFSNDLVGVETSRVEHGKRIAIISKKRRQIAGVGGVKTIVWIVMAAGHSKCTFCVVSAFASFVYVKTEYFALTGLIG